MNEYAGILYKSKRKKKEFGDDLEFVLLFKIPICHLQKCLLDHSDMRFR